MLANVCFGITLQSAPRHHHLTAPRQLMTKADIGSGVPSTDQLGMASTTLTADSDGRPGSNIVFRTDEHDAVCGAYSVGELLLWLRKAGRVLHVGVIEQEFGERRCPF